MRSSLAALVAVVTMALPFDQAQAQSFLETLFGLSAPTAPAVSAPAPAAQRRVAPSSALPLRFPINATSRAASRAARERDEAEADDDGLRSRRTGRFRAVCVRLCDGYYWPMNDRATGQTLYQVADRCKATCGTEARLFYSDRDDADAAAMTDFSGRRYDALNTAFLYRKTLIAGCSCKAAPWSAAEQARHQGYVVAAAAAAAEKQRLAAAEAVRKEAGQQRLAATAPLAGGMQVALAVSPTQSRRTLQNREQLPVGEQRDAETSAKPGVDRMAEVGADGAESRFEPTAGTVSPSAAPSPSQAFAEARADVTGAQVYPRGFVGRARTQRVSERPNETRPRPMRAASRRAGPQKITTSSGGGFGLFASGKPKYRWPGD